MTDDSLCKRLENLSISSTAVSKPPSLELPIIAHVIHLLNGNAVLSSISKLEETVEEVFLEIDRKSCNTSVEKYLLFIGAKITVISAKKVHDKPDSATRPRWKILKYKLSSPPPAPLRTEIAIVFSVHRNYIMIVGSNIRHPLPVYVSNPASFKAQSFVIGELYELPEYWSSKLFDGKIFHCKGEVNDSSKRTQLVNSYSWLRSKQRGPDPTHFMTTVRKLTAEEERLILSGCENFPELDLAKAQLYIRDPLVSIKRLDLYLERFSASQRTITVKDELPVLCDRRGTHPKYLVKLSLSKDEVRRCLKSSSIDCWHVGTELVVHWPAIGTNDLSVTVDSIAGNNVTLVAAKHCQKLAEILSKNKDSNLQGATVGPQLAKTDDAFTKAILRGFDDFFKRLGSVYCGRQIVKEDSPISKEGFKVNGNWLDKSQLHAMRMSAAKEGWVCVAAPPGSGKTFMISALVAARQGEGASTRPGSIVMSSTTNCAVNNAVDAIANSWPNMRAVREYSVKAEAELSKTAGKRSLRKMTANAGAHVNLKKFRDLKKALNKRREAKRNLDMCDGKDLRRALKYIALLQQAEHLVRTLFLEAYKPFVFGSTSSLIVMHKTEGTHLILDEASQMSTVDALALYCSMPKLTHITLVGDSQQLKPFNRFDKDSSAYKLMEFGELHRMEQLKSSHKCMLQSIYRCHPRLMELLWQPLYGPLSAGTPATARNLAVQKKLPLAKDKSPCLFVHIEGGHGAGNFNHLELKTVLQFVFDLKKKGISGEDVAIVCHHRLQRDGLVRRLRGKGQIGSMNLLVPIFTIDSFQGKEAKVVLILTTKTCSAKRERQILSALSFVSDPHRETVAVSRAQHAIYLFGDWKNLMKTPFWSKFGKGIHDAGAIVDKKWNPIEDASWLLPKK